MQTEQDLEKLVRTYTPALLRYCTGILGSEHDAQDAVQQTFIKAWQRRHTLREGENNIRAWLYRIAYRTALDILRAALNALSPLDRALMLERVLDGMDYAALARIHGLPAPYLRTRYSRAKAKLAAILKEGEHDDL